MERLARMTERNGDDRIFGKCPSYFLFLLRCLDFVCDDNGLCLSPFQAVGDLAADF